MFDCVQNAFLFYFFIDLLDTSLTKLSSDFIETRRSLVHIEVRAINVISCWCNKLTLKEFNSFVILDIFLNELN